MATNKPPSRKTHISRIFGTNKRDEILSELYADVERIDSAESAMQVPPRGLWQAIKRKFRWCDDPDGEDYDPKGNPSRKTEVLKLCDPEGTDDVNDPEEWIPLRVIKQVKTTSGSGPNQKNQIDNFLNRVINEELRTGREVKVRRVVHCDTNIDDLAQKAADADPTRKEYVVSSDSYTRDIESKDKDQYVEYEIVTKISHSGNSPPDVNGQARQTKLLNDYLIDESEDATRAIRGEGDINPPYRLDPFQNIVNVTFSKTFLVVFFGSILSVKIEEKDKAKFLEKRVKGTNIKHFVKIKSGGKKPVVTTNFTGTVDETGVGFPVAFAFVFPYPENGSVEAADHAVDTFSEGDEETPPPKGVLFAARQGGHPGGTIKWNLNYTRHREDDLLVPPNKMVQCFPTSMTAAIFHDDSNPENPFTYTYFGFVVDFYRLDRKGEATVYKGDNPGWKADVSFRIQAPLLEGGESLSHGVKWPTSTDPTKAPLMPLISTDIPK